MAFENILNFEEIKEQLGVIENSCEETQASLKAIDTEIKQSVGADGAAWAGNSANEFRASWDDLADELPTFISYVNTQAKNIEMMLTKTEATDETGTGQVN